MAVGGSKSAMISAESPSGTLRMSVVYAPVILRHVFRMKNTQHSTWHCALWRFELVCYSV